MEHTSLPQSASSFSETHFRARLPWHARCCFPYRAMAIAPPSPSLLQGVVDDVVNAAKFTDVGTIALRADTRSNLVCIDVCDSGIGIPADQLELIFEPFRQVEGERAHLGTGLGLAIARKLATLMGGTLTAAGNLGHGSTFSLVLPAAQAPGRRTAAA